MEKPKKILALQFKYFGDAVLMTPALRSLHEKFPESELHVLVPENIAPVLQHLPWVDRVWPMPRQRGRANFRQTWPVIQQLRREQFDRSVDFASNDRGAILSFLIGARQRLGWAVAGGFWGRRFCYTERVVAENEIQHESARLAHLLSAWNITTTSLLAEIRTDPNLDSDAKKLLPSEIIICHLASSQSKKEWPLIYWANLHEMAVATGMKLIFSTGTGAREETLLKHFQRLAPTASTLKPVPDLALYLAMLKHAGGFVSGDTGPLHFAAALGVPTLALFGPSSPSQWAPIGQQHHFLAGGVCSCGNVGTCQSSKFCLTAITPEAVFAELKKLWSHLRCN